MLRVLSWMCVCGLALVMSCGDGDAVPNGDSESPPVDGRLTFDPEMVLGKGGMDAEVPTPPPEDEPPLEPDAGDDAGVDAADELPEVEEWECRGVATPCSLRTAGTCYSTGGCSSGNECKGVARSCYSQYYSFQCYDIQGCTWSSYSESCSGSAWSCGLISSSYSCTSQGCSWTSVCKGVATSCSTFRSAGVCELQPGCRWEQVQ